MATSAVCVGAVRTSTCRGPHAARSNSAAAMVPRMRFSRFRVIIITQRAQHAPRRRAMNKVATSTTQVACAGLLVLCCCVVTDAQTPAASPASTRQSRAAFARELRDSLSLVLRAGVLDRAFPGAYAIVGDSRGVLAEYGTGHLDWSKSPVPDRRTLGDLASPTK